MPIGALLGVLVGMAGGGSIAWLFHHDVMRIYNARAWLARGGVLVDVDAEGEFARHHPRVAVNVPLEDLLRRAHELGEKDTPIVVFAHSWRRGAQAVHELRGMGFWDVMNVSGVRTKERLSAAASEAAKTRAAEARGVPGTVELGARTG